MRRTIELIIWAVSAGALGLGLGYVGYFHSKIAYGIFTTCLSLFTFGSSYLVNLTGGDVAGMTAMQSETGNVLAMGIFKNLMRSVDAMGYLPFHVQVAILVFAVAFFLSRIATWAGVSFGPSKAEETAAERKKRVLKSYGMKSMDDVRALR